MNTLLTSVATSALLALSAEALTLNVTNANDTGAGSFRDALTKSSYNMQIDRIVFRDSYLIQPESTLEFKGSQSLSIEGNGAVIDGSLLTGGDIFLSKNAVMPLSISHLGVTNSPANGIVVRTKTYMGYFHFMSQKNDIHECGIGNLDDWNVGLILDNVDVNNSALYGVHLDDNEDPLDDGDFGSMAGASLIMKECNILLNGTGEIDYDGVRIDERSRGSIHACIIDTHIDRNGGDGFELDEGGNGHVFLDMVNSTLNDNGYFDEEDLDDGVDIDEAGSGDVVMSMINVQVYNNMDEGLDIDEEDDGDIRATIACTDVNNSLDENGKFSEEGVGSAYVTIVNSSFTNSRENDGLEIESEDEGQAIVNLNGAIITDNNDDGLEVKQDDDVNLGNVKLRNNDISSNGDDNYNLDNVNVDSLLPI